MNGADSLPPDVATAFADVARGHADCPALVAPGTELTFAELAAAAGAVASAIVERGVAPGTPVGLLSHNASAGIIGALGIAGAGCATVALDPGHPPARLAGMLEAFTPPLVLHAAEHATLAAELLQGRAGVPLDITACEPRDAASFPVRRPRPDDLALINFTSGTTGIPKGSAESFADAIGRYHLYADTVGLHARDRLGLVHYFGGCRVEVYGALLSGACVYLYDLAGDGLTGLADWLDGNAISVARFFPTTWRGFADSLGSRRLQSLRRLVLLGEPARADDVWRVRRHLPADALVFSMYASNEASTVTSYRIDGETQLANGLLPAGWPLAGKQIALIDEAGEPVAPGQVGEIVVSAPRIFRGYFKQPELTAQVLATTDSGAQQFRTGDRGRLDTSGCLEVLGRADTMVKLRGHRIELAEVERAIDACPGVLQSAVSVRTRPDGNPQMVAHVLRSQGPALRSRDLRRRLGATLPRHMLPGVIVMLDEAPLTANGKLERHRLSVPAPLPQGRPDGVGPAAALESALADIWAELLDTREIDQDADFFELGGDSLLAAMSLVEFEALTGKRLALASFAEHSTIRRLAAAAAEGREGGAEPPVVTVHGQGTGAALFGVCGLRGHGLRLAVLARRLPTEHPVHALQPPGLSWDRPPRHTIESMAGFYLEEIRRLQPAGPYHLIGTSFGTAVAFEIACQMEAAGDTVAWLCLLDGDSPRSELGPELLDLAPASLGEGDPDALARRHRDALLRYQPSTRLRAPVHFGLCVEALVREADPRDWRALLAGPVSVHLLPGLHGAFHAEPQRGQVVRLLNRLLDAPGAVTGFTPAAIFQRFEVSNTAVLDRRGRRFTLTAMAPGRGAIAHRAGTRMTRLEGWCVGTPGAAQPGRLLVFAADRYLGWGAIARPYTPPGESAPRACGFRIDIRVDGAQCATLRAIALDEVGGTALELPAPTWI